jgi:hypothetical protein
MFNISSLFNGIGAAATKLLTLAATDEESIFTFTNDHPMVKSAIQLAEQEVGAMPQVAEAETIASAVLGLAQVIASATKASANLPAAPTAPTAPLPAAANNDGGIHV